MSLEVVWSPGAVTDLRAIVNWQDAAWIVREVNRYAGDGIGALRIVLNPSGTRAWVLFLPSFRVFLAWDRRAARLSVLQILRSTRT